MSWRLAEGLKKLRDQVNAAFPNRNKAWDGSIGDEAHQTRDSDHNPWVKDHSGQPIVTAIDITHDPANGFDSYAFADMLLKNRDPRIKYVISNRRIGAGNAGPAPWTWRKYTGKNPHDHHVHISILSDEPHFDNVSEWKIDNFKVDATTAHPVPITRPLLVYGATGDDVKYLQGKLGEIPVSGNFDLLTKYAVRVFQLKHGLTDDGKVGSQTWKAVG